MRFGTGKVLGALAPFLVVLALGPAAMADAQPGAVASVKKVRPTGAATAATVTFLTINGLSGVENRISVFNAPTTGRLTLIAPEGLTDPDGPIGANCMLDNATPGQAMATQISCNPGYAQVIVGDLGGGNDNFSAAADMSVLIGNVLDGVRRPMSGGIGDDRIVGGGGGDLLDGGIGADALLGGLSDDLLTGGGGPDKLGGGPGRDALYGGSARDKLRGGRSRDLCSGGGGKDRGSSCDIFQSIP